MDTKKYLDLVGLKHYDSKIKTFIANSITDAEAVYTDSLVKKDENGVVLNPWQIITDETLLNQAPTSKAVLDYVGTFAKSVKDTVEGLSVNGKTFGTTGEVVLYAGDIKMSDAADATTVKAEIEGIKGAIAGGVHFIGVETALPNTANNGDIVIVGNKEYIWDEEMTSPSATTYKWIELGDTTAELQRIASLEDRMTDTESAITDMSFSYTLDAEGTGEGEIAVVTGVNLTQEYGQITIMTVDSAKAATKAYVDTQDAATLKSAKEYTDDVAGEYSKTEGETTTTGTGLRKEIEERDAATLDAAKKYADDKVKDITDGNYVKSFGGKTGDITLSAEGNVTLEMVDNALKASYDDTNADGISWKETQAITTDEIDALFV